MTGREILQKITNKQSTWTWWITPRPPNLNEWKRNLAREAHPTIDLILIKNQSTYIEKEKPKNNDEIRQHEKTNPPLNSPSPFPLSNPFFAQTVAITIVIAIQPGNLQWRMRPALSPSPHTARSKGNGSGDSSWSCKHLAVAMCKSFPQAYADRRFHHQIKT